MPHLCVVVTVRVIRPEVDGAEAHSTADDVPLPQPGWGRQGRHSRKLTSRASSLLVNVQMLARQTELINDHRKPLFFCSVETVKVVDVKVLFC